MEESKQDRKCSRSSTNSVTFAEEYVAMNQKERRQSLGRYARRKSSIGVFMDQVSSSTNQFYKSMKRRLSIVPSGDHDSKNSSNQQLLESIRMYVLDGIESADKVSINVSDVNMICNSDDMIDRFLKEYLKNRDLDKLIDQETIIAVGDSVLETLKWRQKFGVHNLKNSKFPREIFQSGLIFVDLDSYHEPIVYIDVANYPKIPGCTEIYVDCLLHILITVRENSGGKISIIADCSKLSFSNVDISFLATIIPILINHFPQTVSFFWIVNLPWYAKSAGYFITKLIPDIFRSIDKATAIRELGEDIVAQKFGGKNMTNIELPVPEDASDLETVAKAYKLSPASISKWKKFFKDNNL